MNILQLIRPHLLQLKPYSSARDDFKGSEGIFLDANENAMGSTVAARYNRYPDPHHSQLKKKLSEVKKVSADKIFIGNGSDEPIDLLIRLFCNPGADHIIICPPTYGMYAVSAEVNNVKIKEVLLTSSFQLNTGQILENADTGSKILFLCSPNNPTGNLINKTDIETCLKNFRGIVVIDEAYIDFAPEASWLSRIDEFPNLVILQTFSKAWGLANLRVGMCFASQMIISYMEKIKPPYNVNGYSQQTAIQALENEDTKNKYVATLVKERQKMKTELAKYSSIKEIFPSDSNFLLVRVNEAKKLYDYFTGKGIVVRNRSSLPLCENTLRITIGTPEENKRLIEVLDKYEERNN